MVNDFEKGVVKLSSRYSYYDPLYQEGKVNESGRTNYKPNTANDFTAFTNRSTNKMLESINVLVSAQRNFGDDEQIDLTGLQKKTFDLYVENRDMNKSIKRGFRDLVRGNSLKTEMKQRINAELIEPLRDYINKEDTQTYKPKEEINATLDTLTEKCLSTSNHR